jgi:hypothetical protein
MELMEYIFMRMLLRGTFCHGNTHGCINLVKGDAEDLYNAVTGKTRILIEYDW